MFVRGDALTANNKHKPCRRLASPPQATQTNPPPCSGNFFRSRGKYLLPTHKERREQTPLLKIFLCGAAKID
jgi:hypothetical protein